MNKRVFIAIADVFGIGVIPGGGDVRQSTIKRIYDTGKLNVPGMRGLGLFNLDCIGFGRRSCLVSGAFGKCTPLYGGDDDGSFYDELFCASDGVDMLDLIKSAGYEAVCIGGAAAIRGAPGPQSEKDVMLKLIAALKSGSGGVYVAGVPLCRESEEPMDVCRSLNFFDKRIGQITQILRPSDILIVTALHGLKNEGGYAAEYVPLLVCGKPVKGANPLDFEITHADVGATVLEYFNVANTLRGKSFLGRIIKQDKIH
ncbi:MAG: hypothetical protein J5879_02140 [Clostridia bacterium]|nr:hypothetical protein [Clostridia bacterium]